MSVLKAHLSRRTALRLGVVASVASATVRAWPAMASGSRLSDADAKRRGVENRVKTGRVSPNGWEMEKGSDIGGGIWTVPVEGSGLLVATRIGDVQTVLLHAIRRFHYEIGYLEPGEVEGFRKPAARNSSENNHASGTAVDIRPGWYPRGTRGLNPAETQVVRAILADCEGVVRWGGDLADPHESHFEIAVPPEDLRLVRVADKIRLWNELPGQGAGVLRGAA